MKKASESKVLQGPAGRMSLSGAEVGAFWGRTAEGFDPLQLHLLQILPASGCNRSRGMSSGMSQGHRWKPAVILALRPEESKGQSDVLELRYTQELSRISEKDEPARAAQKGSGPSVSTMRER
jgi:hypothetical protein